MTDSHHHPEAEIALRVKAIESLLIEKGIVDPAALDVIIEHYEHTVGPHIGAQIVAKAWVDAAFKQRLLADGTAAIAELGLTGFSSEHMVVVENTPEVHNLVVCTLCSCYRRANRPACIFKDWLCIRARSVWSNMTSLTTLNSAYFGFTLNLLNMQKYLM